MPSSPRRTVSVHGIRVPWKQHSTTRGVVIRAGRPPSLLDTIKKSFTSARVHGKEWIQVMNSAVQNASKLSEVLARLYRSRFDRSRFVQVNTKCSLGRISVRSFVLRSHSITYLLHRSDLSISERNVNLFRHFIECALGKFSKLFAVLMFIVISKKMNEIPKCDEICGGIS